MYAHVHPCTHMYAYIYPCTHIYTHVHTYIRRDPKSVEARGASEASTPRFNRFWVARVYARTWVYICVHVCTWVSMCVHGYTCVYMCVHCCISVYVCNGCICAYMPVHGCVCAYMGVYMRTCVYIPRAAPRRCIRRGVRPYCIRQPVIIPPD